MSYSMLSNELWMPAKKVAIALESLIRGQFPRDVLHLVGFNYRAREYKPEEIVAIAEWDNMQGTNMIHALMLARTLLARSRAANKQITDDHGRRPDGAYGGQPLDLQLAAADQRPSCRRCAR